MSVNRGRSVLYISYDGMLEALGQSQVLAYLEKLAVDRPVHLISFEKTADRQKKAEWALVHERILASGIHWHPLSYHKRPSSLATAWDIGVGIVLGLVLVLRYRLCIVHARSYVPSVMALVIKRLTGVRFLFDMRGFWADERLDGGIWRRSSYMYAIAKWFERKFLQEADHVVSLTQAAVHIMTRFDYLRNRQPPYTVIPTCANLSLFHPMEVPQDGGFVLGYVGTVGTWYLFDEVAACVARLVQIMPSAHFLVVNRGEHEYIRQCLLAHGVFAASFTITEAAHRDVPALMARMDAGIFFIKPVFSKQASAPTKLAEFLGCGIPCLTNAGIGDMAEVIEQESVGVALRGFDPESLSQGLEALLCLTSDTDTRHRCVTAAHRHFSLEEGVARYRRIYSSLDCHLIDKS